MKQYKHLSSEERELMSVFHAQKYSINKIAKILHRSKSTIWRELNRETSVSADFARSYLTNNPKATEQDLQVGLRNHLQELKKSGVKISNKQVAQANATVGNLYKVTSAEIKATMLPKVSATAETAVNGLNTQQARVSYPKYNVHLAADHHYEDLAGLSKKARTNLHKKNIAAGKAAFGGDAYQEWLKENHPELIESEAPKPTSNKKNKKEANADYQSSKKEKTAKKNTESKSKAEHKKWRNTKSSRNAGYCTSQGIMTKPAKEQYDSVKKALNGNINVSVNEEANSTLKKMGEYYQNLEAAMETPKPTSTKSSTATQAVRDIAKEVKGSKLGWIAGIGAGLVAIAGIVSMNKKDSTEKEMNEVA